MNDLREINKEKGKQEKITVKMAAELLGTSEQFIRVALQRGLLPFGVAMKTSSQYTYCIYPKKFYEYVEIKRRCVENDDQ